MTRVLNDPPPVDEFPFLPEKPFEDLTPEEQAQFVENFEAQNKIIMGKEYLKQTDWYVTRNAETGAEIPEDVLEKRAQARQDASST